MNNYLEGRRKTSRSAGRSRRRPGVIPSDIEIRRNHITKPLAWKGGPWLMKNLIELKVGQARADRGATSSKTMGGAQQGFAFVLWSVNQQTTCTWCVTDTSVQNNLIRNVAGGWSMDATGSTASRIYSGPDESRDDSQQRRDRLGQRGGRWLWTDIRDLQYDAGATDCIADHRAQHRVQPVESSFIWAGAALPMPNHIVRNNLVGGGQYQLFTVYGQGAAAWQRVGGPGSVFAGNVVAAFGGGTMVAGNYGPGSLADVGLVGGPGAATSPTASITDLGLMSSSGYVKKGTDGKDPGADVAAVKAATANVVMP